MSDERRSGRGRSRGRSRRRPAEDDWDSYDDWEDDDEEEDRAPTRGRRGKKKPSRSGRKRGDDGPRFDFGAAEDDDPDAGGDEDDRDDDHRPRRRRSTHRPPGKQKLTLMDLCTPVLGYASLLHEEGVQPGYQQFREQILTAIQRIENQAGEYGIETEDARLASYALCFFMDSQVAGSDWNAKGEWAAEPLGIVLQQDAEGGVNFFNRLDSLGDRQKAVKEVFLVCLALGFRGKYAELEATQQAAEIGEIRQKLVRSLHPKPMEKLPELFPEAYDPALPIEDEVPPSPRWWLFASLGAVALAVALYLLLFFLAGRSHEEPLRALENVAAASGDTSATDAADRRAGR